MARNISFYKVVNNEVRPHFRVYNVCGTHISSKEAKEKAVELYKRYKCNGILIVTIKENIWGDNVGGSELYYDGEKFKRDTLNISFLVRQHKHK